MNTCSQKLHKYMHPSIQMLLEQKMELRPAGQWPLADSSRSEVNARSRVEMKHGRMMPSNFVWNHLIPLSIFSPCWKLTLHGRRLQSCTRSPGRDNYT